MYIQRFITSTFRSAGAPFLRASYKHDSPPEHRQVSQVCHYRQYLPMQHLFNRVARCLRAIFLSHSLPNLCRLFAVARIIKQRR